MTTACMTATFLTLPASSGSERSGAAPAAPYLLLDVGFGDLAAPVDVPGVHHQADPPAADDEHRPEEGVRTGECPDRHDKGVDEEVDQQVAAEVTALLQPVHREVVRGSLS